VVPGATEPSTLRLPLTETTRFIDLEDSIYTFKADELFNKRTEVEVNDDVPTYYHKSKRYVRGKKGRYGKRTRYSKRRSSVRSRRASAGRKSSSVRRRGTASKKRKSTRRRRR